MKNNVKRPEHPEQNRETSVLYSLAGMMKDAVTTIVVLHDKVVLVSVDADVRFM